MKLFSEAEVHELVSSQVTQHEKNGGRDFRCIWEYDSGERCVRRSTGACDDLGCFDEINEIECE